MTAVENVHIVLGQGRRKTTVNWDSDGLRYYYYVDGDELDPLERFDGGKPCVFRVELDSSGNPDRVAPKLLKFMLPSVRRMVAEASKVVTAKKLMEKALAKQAAQKAAEQAERKLGEAEKKLLDKFGSHGRALLHALESIANSSREVATIKIARDALAKVEEV